MEAKGAPCHIIYVDLHQKTMKKTKIETMKKTEAPLKISISIGMDGGKGCTMSYCVCGFEKNSRKRQTNQDFNFDALSRYAFCGLT